MGRERGEEEKGGREREDGGIGERYFFFRRNQSYEPQSLEWVLRIVLHVVLKGKGNGMDERSSLNTSGPYRFFLRYFVSFLVISGVMILLSHFGYFMMKQDAFFSSLAQRRPPRPAPN